MSAQATTRRREWLSLLLASNALLAVVAASLALGKYRIPIVDLSRALTASPDGGPPDLATVRTVLWSIRVPRVLAGVFVGAGLAAAGAAYQAMFRNPLVSPDVLGVSAGAGFGALLAIFLGWPVAGVQASAFVGGLVAVTAVTSVATRVRRHDPVLVLVLAGVAVGTLLAAGTSLLKILADPYTQLPAMTYWLLGGLSAVTAGDVRAAAPLIVVATVPLWLLRWRMNLLTLADEEAAALGVDVRRLRAALVTSATLITAAAVSISGTIGWVGLVVPHVARLLVGPDFRWLLPMSVLTGGAFVVGADTVARTVAPIEIPLGVLTAMIGAPFFLWLLGRSRRGW